VLPFSDAGEIFEAYFWDQRCDLSEELCVSTVHQIIARAPQHSGSDICSRISWHVRLQTWCLCTCFRIGKVNYYYIKDLFHWDSIYKVVNTIIAHHWVVFRAISFSIAFPKVHVHAALPSWSSTWSVPKSFSNKFSLQLFFCQVKMTSISYLLIFPTSIVKLLCSLFFVTFRWSLCFQTSVSCLTLKAKVYFAQHYSSKLLYLPTYKMTPLFTVFSFQEYCCLH